MRLKESLKVMAQRAFSVPGAGIHPHHTDWPKVDGASVELHFTPSTVYSFFYNQRVQRYFEEALPRCEGNRLPVDVDIVFQLMHLRRHLISEGVGLRQVMDLYWTMRAYTLQCQSEQTCISSNLRITLKRLGLSSFAEAMMWVLQELFLMPTDEMICSPDKKRGEFVLKEILEGGNFGRDNKHKGKVVVTGYNTCGFMCILIEMLEIFYTREFVCSYVQGLCWSVETQV